jgi:hypothetical protein
MRVQQCSRKSVGGFPWTLLCSFCQQERCVEEIPTVAKNRVLSVKQQYGIPCSIVFMYHQGVDSHRAWLRCPGKFLSKTIPQHDVIVSRCVWMVRYVSNDWLASDKHWRGILRAPKHIPLECSIETPAWYFTSSKYHNDAGPIRHKSYTRYHSECPFDLYSMPVNARVIHLGCQTDHNTEHSNEKWGEFATIFVLYWAGSSSSTVLNFTVYLLS